MTIDNDKKEDKKDFFAYMIENKYLRCSTTNVNTPMNHNIVDWYNESEQNIIYEREPSFTQERPNFDIMPRGLPMRYSLNRENIPNEFHSFVDFLEEDLHFLNGGILLDHSLDRKRTKKLMDVQYPHRCLKCNETIQYEHVFNDLLITKRIFSTQYIIHTNKNYSTFETIKYGFEKAKRVRTLRKQLKQWWINNNIEFLCCACYELEKNKNYVKI